MNPFTPCPNSSRQSPTVGAQFIHLVVLEALAKAAVAVAIFVADIEVVVLLEVLLPQAVAETKARL